VIRWLRCVVWASVRYPMGRLPAWAPLPLALSVRAYALELPSDGPLRVWLRRLRYVANRPALSLRPATGISGGWAVVDPTDGRWAPLYAGSAQTALLAAFEVMRHREAA
jgi:hypothetical protein